MHSARRSKGDGSGVNHVAASPLHIVCNMLYGHSIPGAAA